MSYLGWFFIVFSIVQFARGEYTWTGFFPLGVALLLLYRKKRKSKTVLIRKKLKRRKFDMAFLEEFLNRKVTVSTIDEQNTTGILVAIENNWLKLNHIEWEADPEAIRLVNTEYLVSIQEVKEKPKKQKKGKVQ